MLIRSEDNSAKARKPWFRWVLYVYFLSLGLLSIRWDFLGSSVTGSTYSISRLASPLFILCSFMNFKKCFGAWSKEAVLLTAFLSIGVVLDLLLIPIYMVPLVDIFKPLLWLLVFVAVENLTRDPEIKLAGIYCLSISAGLFSLFQIFNLAVRKVDFERVGGLGDAFERGAGAGADANFATVFLAVVVVAGLCVCFGKLSRSSLVRVLMLVVIGLSLLSVYKLVSRGGILALGAGVGCIWLGVRPMGKKMASLVGLLFILILSSVVLLNNEYLVHRVLESYYDGDTSGRTKIWGLALAEFASDYWLSGSGFMNGMIQVGAKMGKTYYGTHNTYIWALLSTGVLGSILFLSFLGRIIRTAFRARFTKFGSIYLGWLAVVLVGAMGLNMNITMIFWVVLAMVSNEDRSSRPVLCLK